ncbi:MAG: efflux RND transporter periplasmic adaptor subunit [Nitrospira sp.]|nr:efflux RND transporter periplasmic adaptor subunit [Nitrospira sp.]MDI3464588.1 RND efflux system, membrane fusion protein [Nitrospira sp.]
MRLVIGVLFVVGAVGLFGCKDETASSAPRPIPEVEVVETFSQTVPDEPELIGQAEASSIVEIRPQVTGIIKQRFFPEGRDVKQGDRLYEIDPVPFRAAFVSAKGRVAQAEARVVQAKQDLARVKPLLVEDAVSQKDVDDAVAEDLAARAALEAARGDLVKAKFDLDNTLIVAPVDGLIERTRYYQGRLVTAQTDLLTVIHQVDPMYVIVSAPESFLLKRRRDTLSKRIQHPGIYKLTGTIIFVDGTTYAHEGVLDFADIGLQVQTGSRQARVVFPNPDRVLLPGQFVTVRFHGVSKPNAILVPQRAVQQGPKGAVVYVVSQGNQVEVRDVKATDWQGDRWIIEEGLRAGERVMVEGFQRVVPGAQVKPVTVASTASTTPPSPAVGDAEQAK